MDPIKNGFGECLKNIRKIKRYTQEALAEKLEINLRQLARIEAGESFVTSDTLCRICGALNVSPWELFNFKIEDECLKTGSGDVVYFKAVKNGNVIHLTSNKMYSEKSEDEKQEIPLSDVDAKMLKMAKNIRNDIVVDEISKGIVVSKKIYRPNGAIITKESASNDLYQELKDKMQKISDSKNKLNFINLAMESLGNKRAREKLKILIDGMNLID